VKHWGARLNHDVYRGYNGYAIRREGRALLFGGDYRAPRRLRGTSAAWSLRGRTHADRRYDPYIYNHCTPEQAWPWPIAAGARLFVPIHHKTFA
jgi:hypothetical protein